MSIGCEKPMPANIGLICCSEPSSLYLTSLRNERDHS